MSILAHGPPGESDDIISYFTGEETETQRGQAPCHSPLVPPPRLKPQLAALRPRAASLRPRCLEGGQDASGSCFPASPPGQGPRGNLGCDLA